MSSARELWGVSELPRTQRGRLVPQQVHALWREAQETGDPALRDRLVLTLAPMVKYIVYKKVREIPGHCEVEDFISCGLEALIKSIDRFDPERGATLEQFAWTRIHGAVLDELRRNDWAPRSLRRWDRDITRARDRFAGLYGRVPSRDELAAAVSIRRAELDRRLQDIDRADVGSLNVTVLADDDTTVERIDTLASGERSHDPEFAALRGRARERFRAAFDRLPPRERQVAVQLYVYNLTLREIGEVLGVSESRVCQLHSALRKRLREELREDDLLFSEVA